MVMLLVDAGADPRRSPGPFMRHVGGGTAMEIARHYRHNQFSRDIVAYLESIGITEDS